MDQAVFTCEYCFTQQLFCMMTDDNECCACGAPMNLDPNILRGTTTRAVDGATCSECGGINHGHYVTCSRAFSPLPRH